MSEQMERFREQQQAVWDGDMGSVWVQHASLIDAMLQPFELALTDAAIDSGATSILDIGCGNGTTTLAIADAAPHARCIGVDLSSEMVATARVRRGRRVNVGFVHADAAEAVLDGPFELMVSRFGVMFFADPAVAFRRLGQAMEPGGSAAMIVWRSPEENPFLTIGRRSAADLGLSLLPSTPGQPGPFSMADPDAAAALLESVGWTDVSAERLDRECVMAQTDLEVFVRHLAPSGVDPSSVESGSLDRLFELSLERHREFISAGDIRFDASAWLLTASRTV